MSTERKPFTFDEKDQLRDIFIPLERVDGDEYRAAAARIGEAYGYAGRPDARPLFNPADPRLTNWLIELYARGEAALAKSDDFRLAFDGGYFRASRVFEQGGWTLAMRRIPSQVPELAELTMPTWWSRFLLDAELLQGGLILVCAPNGQGKTTTASSVVSTRLKLFGGHAVCIEDPPELPLSGWHGAGHCMQIPVSGDVRTYGGDATFASCLKKSLRLFPAVQGGTVLMVGEVRDADTAAEVLLAASNGHLVITTFHGFQIPAALQRFETMASDKLGHASGPEQLAGTLRGVLFQTLSLREGASGWSSGTLSGDLLWSPKPKATAAVGSPIAAALRQRNWDAIGKAVALQNKRLGDARPDIGLDVLKTQFLNDKLL
jgi:twitching motility protein PilT